MLKSECYSFSSSSSNGAFNKNGDNNQFMVNFSPSPLQLPQNAENCKIEIITSLRLILILIPYNFQKMQKIVKLKL